MRQAPVQQITQSTPFPAPTLGINAVDGLDSMGAQDALLLYNMYPAQYGLKVRTGYVEWATDVGEAGGGRTLMPYIGSAAAENTLFCTSQEGIFDVTASGDTFIALVDFDNQDANSGYGQYTSYVTIGGHFLLYCDESNGYYFYDEDAGSWDQPSDAEVTGVDPADLVSVCVHKERVWFVEKDSGTAWYLPAGQIIGEATPFNFASRFKKGGFLVNLYVWTVDGGAGLDDYLVAISSGGDVIVFRGNDPNSATDWFQQGAWYIGEPPVGRRVAGSFGGELYLLSSYGVIPISKLLSGALVQEQTSAVTERITPLIRQAVADAGTILGWEVQLIPTDNLLMIAMPLVTGNDPIQFVQSLNKKGWGIYRDLPYYTGSEWDSQFYFTNGAGTVYVHTGTADNVLLEDGGSEEIDFGGLTAFHDLQPQGAFKRVQFLRATFRAQGIPAYEVFAKYDYDISEGVPVITTSIAGGALWDSAVWDESIWGGGFRVDQRAIGGSGMGRTIAIGWRGQTSIETTLIRLECLHDGGSYL